MASGSSAFPANAGFNQSGGSYYLVVSSINGQVQTYTPGTGSGGATTVGTFVSTVPPTSSASTVYGLGTAAGAVIRDMGKTVVSSGLTFRKFALQAPQSLSTFGVNDGTNTADYSTGYLCVSREGTPTTASGFLGYAKIARM